MSCSREEAVSCLKMAEVFRCVCLVHLLLLQVICLDLTQALITADAHPAKDFSKHTLVKPKLYHGKERRQIATTKEESGEHSHYLRLDYELNGENHILDLRLNRDLIPQQYFTRIQRNGTHHVNKPKTTDVELCHYNGHIRNHPHSWAALSTCHDRLTGVIFDGHEMYYVHGSSIEFVDNESIDKGTNRSLLDEHYFYAHADLIPSENRSCGYYGDATRWHHHHTIAKRTEEQSVNDDYSFERSEKDGKYNEDATDNRILRYKRSVDPIIRGPYNANKQSRFVELVLVVDNREYKELGESVSRVEKHCKDIANIINGLYSPLNIFIALVGVVIWTEYDEVDFSPNGDTTLTNFLHYRREKLIKEHPNDNAQLLTKFTFENGVVGKALKGPICTYEFSGGVNTDHSPVIGLVATTIAHEMGHNFGMEHDSNDCECPDDRCIMAPSSSTLPPTHWSKCSLDYLAVAFEHGMDYCLRNKPEALFGSPVCGNGFVEPGEQCDCGLPEHCDNTCCNATTCMLYRNASCATGECCNLETCKPKSAGTLCRSADYECDLPEYCTGQSEYCPVDIYKRDTEPCEQDCAYCYQGCCRTRSDQCRLLWGNTGKSSDDQCYRMNTKGSRHGNCGYNKLNQSYFKCVEDNVLCGMLHCKHLNERLEFGMESVSILSHSFINLKGSVIPCRTAIIDLGLNQVDPGLSPDGAKCGDGKMCVNQICMAVESLRREMGGCPNSCNGHGVCNSKGHCHCEDGYAPPFCDYPGVGGSEHSGPARDPNANAFVNFTLILFLGVLPLIILILVAFSYFRRNGICPAAHHKSPTVSKSPTKSRGGSAPFSPDSPKRQQITTEDNHSLLADQQPVDPTSPNEFFGHFKGFSLTPIKQNTKQIEIEPIRSAPAIPIAPIVGPPKPVSIAIPSPKSPTLIPTVKNKLAVKPIVRAQSFNKSNQQQNSTIANALSTTNDISVAPALPPLNPGQAISRPIISSPILEASTCTAKELVSPLRNAPKIPIRPAPEVPNKRPFSSADEILVNPVFIEQPTKKVKENKTLSRITSFLKSKNNNGSNAGNSTVAINVPMQESKNLRNLTISNPVPQTHIDIAITALPVDNAETKAAVMRAHSMRGAQPIMRPKIHTFGSMREPGKRPVSIPSGVRPKSPPPPCPNKPDKIPGLPGYQEPNSQYDDCLNEAPLAHISEDNSPTDNIYAVIEETPSPEVKTVNVSSSSSDTGSGLLGEIVSEIQNRNVDSIYSTSTLARKKKLAEAEKTDYVNAISGSNDLYKTPTESEYSNMTAPKSSASSTVSSAYISPNPPVIQNKIKSPTEAAKTAPLCKTSSLEAADQKKTDSNVTLPAITKTTPMSTFKSANNETAGKVAAKRQNSNPKIDGSSSSSKTESIVIRPAPKVPLNRQITPPSIRTRKASPVRSNTPSNISNPNIKAAANKPQTSSKSTESESTKSSANQQNKTTNKGAINKPSLPIRNQTKPSQTNSSVAKSTVGNPKAAGVNAIDKKVGSSENNKPPVAAKTVGIGKTASNVASLQQKFEAKTTNNAK